MIGKPRLVVTDKPRRVNLANYEQRLRKIRGEVALLLTEIDAALERIAAEREEPNG